MNETVYFFLTVISCLIWLGLLSLRGGFWLSNQRLVAKTTKLEKWPSVCVVIPARNEADLIPTTLPSLLTQDYPGSMRVILVDDGSRDGTAKVAREVAAHTKRDKLLEVITTKPKPSGWTGKLHALAEGVRHGEQYNPDYFLFTDADIQHHDTNIRELVVKGEEEDLDLVSLMVLLRCENFWEKLLIPAFVFFFQKLYPFGWVNDPKKQTAAAAGGCILIRRQAYESIGGIEVVRDALIDDCALAQAVKSRKPDGSIWLGLTEMTRSLRPYPSLDSIWDMVARTAFTQLNYSPLLLIGTTIAMTIIYLVPPVALVLSVLFRWKLVVAAGILGWLLTAVAYWPILNLYGRSSLWSFSLPGIAFLYTLMTLDSALRHWQGKGGAWKGRVYGKYGNG